MFTLFWASIVVVEDEEWTRAGKDVQPLFGPSSMNIGGYRQIYITRH